MSATPATAFPVQARAGTRRLGLTDWSVLIALLAWSLLAIVEPLFSSPVHGGAWTGVFGPDPVDTTQYLGWIRDSGQHGLAATLFGMTGGGHVFLQPMWFISGVLWRLGLSLALSYVLWVPVAAVVMWFGFTRFAARYLESDGRRIAAVVLALSFGIPVTWPSLHVTLLTIIDAGDLTPAFQTWLAPHTAIALGLMALTLLGCERLLSGSGARTLALSAATAAAVSWLHSWQGETLLLVIAALVALERSRRAVRVLAPVILAGAVPLLYQFILTRSDPAWRIVEHTSNLPGLRVLTPLLVTVGPLVALALFGLIRRRPQTRAEQLLVLWPVAVLVVYVANPEFPPHALQGVTLPLAVLAVRGWPQGGRMTAAGLAGIAALTLPGLVGFARTLPGEAREYRVLYHTTPGERDALAFLARQRAGGGVLAPYPLSLLVPGNSDLPVWDGHPNWTPDALGRLQSASQFFGAELSQTQARSLIRSSGVRWVLLDCTTDSAGTGEKSTLSPANPLTPVAPLITNVHHFGCATVVEVAPTLRKTSR